MPGVPRSLACLACRKQKKRCDLQQPTCGRCARLDIECIGSGVKQWKFMEASSELQDNKALSNPDPQPSPWNQTTHITSSLVFILEVKDVRHDLRCFGEVYFLNLPRRVGHNETLDLSVSALVAAYNSMRGQGSRVAALSRFGEAMTSWREHLNDPSISLSIKLYILFNVYTCQEWLGSKDPLSTAQHRQVIAYLLEPALMRGELNQLEPIYIRGLCQLIIFESLLNPQVRLDPWFWQVLGVINPLGPHPYKQGSSYQSLSLETFASLALYIREPRRHQVQLQCMYSLFKSERLGLSQDVQDWKTIAAIPAPVDTAVRHLIAYQTAYGWVLAIGSRINRILYRLDPIPQLLDELHGFCDDAITLAENCNSTRPFGSQFVPKFMRIIYATTDKGYRHDDLEKLLADYEHDFEGVQHVTEAKWMAERFSFMEDTAFGNGFDGTDLGSGAYSTAY